MVKKYEGSDEEKAEDHLSAMLFNIFGIIHEQERALQTPARFSHTKS